MGHLTIYIAAALAMTVSGWPSGTCAEPVDLQIVQDRIYREGVFLVVDALVENRSPHRLEAVQISVEFYDFFGGLVRLEHTVLTPSTLGPRQVAAMKVVTPASDDVRKINYRFTWRRGDEQFQAVSPRDVWAIGAATRPRRLLPRPRPWAQLVTSRAWKPRGRTASRKQRSQDIQRQAQETARH